MSTPYDQPPTAPSLSPNQTGPTASPAPDEPLGVHITDVNKSFWTYIWSQKRWQFIALTLGLAAWEIFAIWLFIAYLRSGSHSSSSGRGFGYMLFLPAAPYYGWLFKFWKQFEDAFLEGFARSNGFNFEKVGSVDETYGSIFRFDGEPSVSDVISGQYKQADMRMFIYQLTVGSGRNRQTFRDTVLELDLRGKLPSLLMVSKKSHYISNGLDIHNAFGASESLTLEGDFNRHFNLYSVKGNEVEALEIFNPALMALMEDESKQYTVEFSGNRVYIYINGYVTNARDLTQLFTLAKQLVDKVAPLASNLASDSAMIPTPVNIWGKKRPVWDARSYIFMAALTLIVIAASTGAALLFAKPGAVSTSIEDPPYCGVRADSSMPEYEQQYIGALTTLNQSEYALSQKLYSQHFSAMRQDVETQLAIDQLYIATTATIQFPSPVAADAAAQRQAFRTYDLILANYLAENLQPTLAEMSAHDNALATRHAASTRLRSDFDLPESTCGFNVP